jgi:hypothetical protein
VFLEDASGEDLTTGPAAIVLAGDLAAGLGFVAPLGDEAAAGGEVAQARDEAEVVLDHREAGVALGPAEIGIAARTG